MTPLVRRPCLYQEQGCTWMTQECDQIPTIAEAENYLKLHGADCIHNSAVILANALKLQQWEMEKITKGWPRKQKPPNAEWSTR